MRRARGRPGPVHARRPVRRGLRVRGELLPAAPGAARELEHRDHAEAGVAGAETELTGLTAPAATFDLAADGTFTLTATVALDAAATPLTTAHLVVSVPSSIAGRPDLKFETEARSRQGPGERDVHGGRAFEAAGPRRLVRPAPPGALGRRLRARARAAAARADDRARRRDDAAAHGARAARLGARRWTPELHGAGVPRQDPRQHRRHHGRRRRLHAARAAERRHRRARPRRHRRARARRREHRPALLLQALRPGRERRPRRRHAPGVRPAQRLSLRRARRQRQDPTISNAVVRAWTLLAETDAGKTDFVAPRRPTARGTPTWPRAGTTNALRDYDVAVVPPPESPFGAGCIPQFPLSSGGTSTAPAILNPITCRCGRASPASCAGHGGAPAPP